LVLDELREDRSHLEFDEGLQVSAMNRHGQANPHAGVNYLALLVSYRCGLSLRAAMMMGDQKKNAVMKDDQMVDVNFYALPL
jgi:hypothetical protein